LRRNRYVGRFSFLLFVLAVMLVGNPFIERWVDGVAAFRLLFTGLYIAGVAAVSRRRAVLFVGLGLAAPALISEWLTAFGDVPAFVIANVTSSALFVAFTAGVVFEAILRQERVTSDTVLGGLCIYLLLGIFWMEIYSLIEFLQPGSILLGGEPLTDQVGVEAQYASYPALLYYSFVTLTTLGYGDMIPVAREARVVAALEAVVGQLYVAVFIARLVGLHLAHARRAD
jgi:hypothetical protein